MPGKIITVLCEPCKKKKNMKINHAVKKFETLEVDQHIEIASTGERKRLSLRILGFNPTCGIIFAKNDKTTKLFKFCWADTLKENILAVSNFRKSL